MSTCYYYASFERVAEDSLARYDMFRLHLGGLAVFFRKALFPGHHMLDGLKPGMPVFVAARRDTYGALSLLWLHSPQFGTLRARPWHLWPEARMLLLLLLLSGLFVVLLQGSIWQQEPSMLSRLLSLPVFALVLAPLLIPPAAYACLLRCWELATPELHRTSPMLRHAQAGEYTYFTNLLYTPCPKGKASPKAPPQPTSHLEHQTRDMGPLPEGLRLVHDTAASVLSRFEVYYPINRFGQMRNVFSILCLQGTLHGDIRSIRGTWKEEGHLMDLPPVVPFFLARGDRFAAVATERGTLLALRNLEDGRTFVLAGRTGKSALIWAMLGGPLLAGMALLGFVVSCVQAPGGLNSLLQDPPLEPVLLGLATCAVAAASLMVFRELQCPRARRKRLEALLPWLCPFQSDAAPAEAEQNKRVRWIH